MALKQKIIILVSIFSALFLLWQYSLFLKYQKRQPPTGRGCPIGLVVRPISTGGRTGATFSRCEPYLSPLFQKTYLQKLTRLFVPPTPTPSPPPFSQSYSICKTVTCKDILKYEESTSVVVEVKPIEPLPENYIEWGADPVKKEKARNIIAKSLSNTIEKLPSSSQKKTTKSIDVPVFIIYAEPGDIDFLTTLPEITRIEKYAPQMFAPL